jgi:hypothetical protein
MQSIAGIINCLVSHKETNMQELYEQGENLESVVGTFILMNIVKVYRMLLDMVIDGP